jgi:poly-gamma-glutamate capsule biosynthesis protein CapA/YwtB (metallophosphatase superfamily)
MKIALTGDVMLGRLVDDTVIWNTLLPPATVWGNVLPLLLEADLRFVNLECVISQSGQKWQPDQKAFHFRASPRAIEVLQAARIDAVTLANNHILDYGPEALLECLTFLDRAGIPHAGAGRNLRDALTPMLVEFGGNRVAVVALTDNEPAWEAAEHQPGVNHVAYDRHGLLEPYRTRLAEVISLARRQARFVIISAHVGPNWGAPSPAMRALAHHLLDLGVDLYWGHSNHTPQGIELYQGKAILYSTGDFIDDYAVDPIERNDLSFLFLLDIQDGHLEGLHLHPVRIDNCRVGTATGRDAAHLERHMQAKCRAFGSTLAFQNHVGVMAVP